MSQGFPPQPPPGQNPYGNQPPGQYPPNPYQPGYGPPYPPPGGHDPALGFIVPVGQSIWALLAGYMGLFSLLFCPLGFLAIIFGIVGIMDINKNPQKGGMARCIVGIVLGAISTLGFIIAIVATLANAR